MSRSFNEMALTVRSPLRFPDYFINCTLVEVWDLCIIFHFLCNKADIFPAVFLIVLHTLRHIYFVPIPADTGAKCRVHPLDGIKISCSHHNKPAGHWFGPDHRTTRTFTLTGNGELSFLERSEQVLLGMRIERVDFINEEHATMCPVDSSHFNT